MQTMYTATPNSPSTTLNGAITNVQTSIVVADASVLPTAPNLLTIGYNTTTPETVLMTNKVGNTLTVTRNVEGGNQAWGDTAPIARIFTAYDHNTSKANIEEQAILSVALAIALG